MVEAKADYKSPSAGLSQAKDYAEILTFITAQGEGGVEAIHADENVRLSQKMMAVLYAVDVRTIEIQTAIPGYAAAWEVNVVDWLEMTPMDGR